MLLMGFPALSVGWAVELMRQYGSAPSLSLCELRRPDPPRKKGELKSKGGEEDDDVVHSYPSAQPVPPFHVDPAEFTIVFAFDVSPSSS